MISNYHTHTHRCGHASAERERAYIEKAIELSMKELGFADHAPMPFDNGYRSGIRMLPEKIEDYVNTLLSLREEYKNDIKIRIGFEAEYYPEVFDSFISLISDYPIEYLILGQHYRGNEYDGLGYYGAATDSEEMLTAYVDQVIAGLSTGKFTYLAHPDLINYIGDSEIYSREINRLTDFVVKNDIPVEINLHGIHENKNYPNKDFWRIASAAGCKALLGCDAHSPNGLARAEAIKKAEELIKENKGLKLIEKVELKSIK